MRILVYPKRSAPGVYPDLVGASRMALRGRRERRASNVGSESIKDSDTAGKDLASNPCTINSCASQPCNPFRMNTYTNAALKTLWNEHLQKNGGWGQFSTASIHRTVVQSAVYPRRREDFRCGAEAWRGQRASTVVVRPPRGVNSPRTVHHAGRAASTMSRRMQFTAFS